MISLLSRVRSNRAQIAQSIDAYFLIQTQGHYSPFYQDWCCLCSFSLVTLYHVFFFTFCGVIFARGYIFTCQYSHSHCEKRSSGSLLGLNTVSGSLSMLMLLLVLNQDVELSWRHTSKFSPGWEDTGSGLAPSHSELEALSKSWSFTTCWLCVCVWCWWDGIVGMEGSSLQYLCLSRILLS